MDILYLLVPLSVALVLALIGVFAWAVRQGQFDDLDREGGRILEGDEGDDGDEPIDGPSVAPGGERRTTVATKLDADQARGKERGRH